MLLLTLLAALLVAQEQVAMGLSLGEYSALCFAGAMSFEDGVRLTMARGIVVVAPVCSIFVIINDQTALDLLVASST
jgi:malonyl CoA-acyl carrier protein transacylase